MSASRVALQDAKAPAQYCSAQRRLDAAYDAGLSCALALLEANKLEAEGEGHHREAMDYMVNTLRLKGNTAAAIPVLTRARHDGRYDGRSNVNEQVVAEGIKWAQRVLAETEQWFSVHNALALKL